MSTTTPTDAAMTTGPTPVRRTVHAEWTKLATSRATTVSVVVASAGAVTLSALALAGQRSEWSTMTAGARAALDPTSKALVGVIVAALVIGALGVRASASEHATGMIRLTYTAMPQRGLVVAAKAVLVGGVGVAVGLVANTIAIVVGQHILPSGVGTGLAEPGVPRAIVFGAAGVGLIAVMGVALGSLLRRAATANILLALLVIGGQLVGAALPVGARRYLPSATLEALVTTKPSGDTLPSAVAMAVLSLAAAAVLAVAVYDTERRDL